MTIRDKKYEYEIVDRIPTGFCVWNIGDNMADGYIPLCESLYPEAKKDDLRRYAINVYTLKAIKLSKGEVKALREAAAVGINSKTTAEKASRSRRTGYWSNIKRQQAQATLEIFERISE